MLRISLVFALAFVFWPLSALAQNNGTEALQIFEFDYDQSAAPVVNLPPRVETPAQQAPAAAPAPVQTPAPTVTPAARPGAPAKPVAPAAQTTARPAAPAATPAKSPAATPAARPGAPAKAAAPAPRPTTPAQTQTKAGGVVKDGVITIIGEPDPPGTQYDDFLPDHRAESITLSPAGSPPTTRVPAQPGEARVERSGTGQAVVKSSKPAQPAAARRPAASPVAETAAPTPSFEPGSVHRFWQLAQNNWAQYGGTPHSRPPERTPHRSALKPDLISYNYSGVILQDLTTFSGFGFTK
jgi:hypothetical protein